MFSIWSYQFDSTDGVQGHVRTVVEVMPRCAELPRNAHQLGVIVARTTLYTCFALRHSGTFTPAITIQTK
jgi:hypothetical protein